MWCMSLRNITCLCCYSCSPPFNAFFVDSFDFMELFPWRSLAAWTMLVIFVVFKFGTKLVALFTREMYMLLLLHPVIYVVWIG